MSNFAKRLTIWVTVVTLIVAFCVCPVLADSWTIVDDYNFLARFSPSAFVLGTGSWTMFPIVQYYGGGARVTAGSATTSVLTFDPVDSPSVFFPVTTGLSYVIGGRSASTGVGWQMFQNTYNSGFLFSAPQDPELSLIDVTTRINYLISSGQSDGVLMRFYAYVNSPFESAYSNIPNLYQLHLSTHTNLSATSITASSSFRDSWVDFSFVRTFAENMQEYTLVVKTDHLFDVLSALYDRGLSLIPEIRDQIYNAANSLRVTEGYGSGEYNIFCSDLYLTTTGVLLPDDPGDDSGDDPGSGDTTLIIGSISDLQDALETAIALGIDDITSVQVAQTDRLINIGSDVDMSVHDGGMSDSLDSVSDLEGDIMDSLDTDGVDTIFDDFAVEGDDTPSSAYVWLSDFIQRLLDEGFGTILITLLSLSFAFFCIGRGG